MDKRRLGGGGFVAALVCALMFAGVGCAQGGRADGAAKVATGKEEGTESLLARQAAGLERVLSGEQARAAARKDGADEAGKLQSSRSNDQAGRGSTSESGASVVVAPLTDSGPIGAGVPSAAPVSAAPLPPNPSAATLSGWWSAQNVEGEHEMGAVPGGGSGNHQGTPVASPAVVAASQFWKPEEGSAGTGVGAGGGKSLRISALALCTRVEGFGRYTKVDAVRAVSRPVPLLIYTQVDGFAYRKADGSAEVAGGNSADDGKTDWAIELGQSVVVYRMGADGKSDVQVKVEPEQASRDVAKFKRRDHFMVQHIELPTPLVPGKYVVKVTVRDKATGVVDEKMAEVMVR